MKRKFISLFLGVSLAIFPGKAAEVDEQLSIPTAPSHGDILEDQIGGTPDIPPLERLQGYTACLSLEATTLADAIDLIHESLQGIEGSDFTTQIETLKGDLKEMTRTCGQEEVSKNALKRELAARNGEQADTRKLLHDILNQLVPPVAPKDTPTPTTLLSKPQEQLLKHRQKIGDHAWALLGGTNATLAAALARSIEGLAGQTVEVFYVGTKNFTLRVNGKVHKKPYGF